MAKKTTEGGKVNKAKAIRDYKNANKAAKPKDIAAALKEQGLDLTPQYVSVILSGARRKAGKVARRGRPPKSESAAAAATPAAPAAPRSKSTAVADYAPLLSAKELVASAGSVDKARAALEAFAKLVGQ